MATDIKAIRKRVNQVVEKSERTDSLGWSIDIFLMTVIAFNVVLIVLETVPAIRQQYEPEFTFLETISVLIFTIEYLLRLWSCVDAPEAPKDRPNWYIRLRYALKPMSIIDMVAIFPFYATLFFDINLRHLQALRLFRVFKFARYSTAMTTVLDVFREEASSFVAAFFIMFVLLILAASGAYIVEYEVQPDAFGSIPAAMWWAIVTLTTVGYGDVTPITPLGKLFGALVTVVGIGMAALPAGILASGLADQLKAKRQQLELSYMDALSDGIIDDEERKNLEELRQSLGVKSRDAKIILEEIIRKQSGHAGHKKHGKSSPKTTGVNKIFEQAMLHKIEHNDDETATGENERRHDLKCPHCGKEI